jgi:hypothetical protein
MGKYNTTQDQDVEEIQGALGGYWSSPTYWKSATNEYVYYAGVVAEQGKGDYLKMFTMANGLVSTTPVAQSPNLFPVGATPSISANGTTNGVLWAVERPDALGVSPGKSTAVVYAYDATNVATTLYNSGTPLSQGVPRDRGGCANKFAVPTIANGRVYVGTQNELDVFGLLSSTPAPGVSLSNPCWTFPTSVLGTSVTQAITVSNSGSVALTVSNVAITGTNAADFTQTNTCATLAPGAKCVITVTFKASVLGPESAYVMLTDNAVGSPHNVFFVGSGKN